jgi:hypothetical protein
MQGCCSFGAHFVDEADEKTVKRSAKRLSSRHWQFKDKAKKIGWSTTDKNGTVKTRVVDGACIFLNRPGFEGGVGCALHIAATEAGERPMDWKPDVCWQLPIRRDYTWVQAHDGTQKLVITITEYVRAMWGEGGHDFDWYCSSNTEAHIATEPLYVTNRAELIALIGEPAYAELAIRAAQTRQRAGQKVEKRKGSGVAVLPGKLTDCESKDLLLNEVFLVEGDSAGGSAKMGRDKETQAILPLRGKVLNSWEVERDRLFANNEIHDIAVAVGVDPHGPHDESPFQSGCGFSCIFRLIRLKPKPLFSSPTPLITRHCLCLSSGPNLIPNTDSLAGKRDQDRSR